MVGSLPLTQVWAYKYDGQSRAGIDIHADKAQVNLNLWLSPDGGDDIDGDGMTVWTREPPDGWSFTVSCHDTAGIWVAFFSRCQRYRCGQASTCSASC